MGRMRQKERANNAPGEDSVSHTDTSVSAR